MPASHGWIFEVAIGGSRRSIVFLNVSLCLAKFSTGIFAVRFSRKRRTLHPIHAQIKRHQSKSKNVERYPRFIVGVIFAAWRFSVNVFEAARAEWISNHPQWKLIWAISVGADCYGDAFLTLMMALELPCCQWVDSLQASETTWIVHVVNVLELVRVQILTYPRKCFHICRTAFAMP